MNSVIATFFVDRVRQESYSPGVKELALTFLQLGATSFGGPAAHIALMRRELVEKRRWLDDEEFLGLLSASNMIPGPNSTELAIHIGYKRAGWAGLVVAGACFIFPAFLITLAAAGFYVRFGRLPQAQAILYGIKPVIIAIVLHALLGLRRIALKTGFNRAQAFLAFVASLLGASEFLILLVCGLTAMVSKPALRRPLSILPIAASAVPTSALAGSVPLTGIFGSFLKIGSVLYGSGYVLLAFLQSEFVDRLGWLTSAQILDAVAAGQFTPGPVFSTATFIGYVLAGVPGGIAATLGIFLPAFFFVALSVPLLHRIRSSTAARGFLEGVSSASFALMAAVTVLLGGSTLFDFTTATIASGALLLLIKTKINSAYLILGGGTIGLWASL